LVVHEQSDKKPLVDECLSDICKKEAIEKASYARRLDYSILDFHCRDKFDKSVVKIISGVC
jgi:hypothetical protein